MLSSVVRLANSTTSNQQQQEKNEKNQHFLQTLRLKALHNFQRSLESLSSLTANSLMLNAALRSTPHSKESFDYDNDFEDDTVHQHDEFEIGDGAEQRQEEQGATITSSADAEMGHAPFRPPSTSSKQQRQHSVSPLAALPDNFETTTIDGHRQHQLRDSAIRWIRADLKQIPTVDNEMLPSKEEKAATTTTTTTSTFAEDPPGHEMTSRRPTKNKLRRMRSAMGRHGGGHGHGHHRRRRKGCPAVLHSKDQLLCPSRNAHRYDVCITREQLCDRIRDCPGGEDEDPRQCFFFRPLENSLKTISHAVLLLVDTVMREQEKQQQRNEL